MFSLSGAVKIYYCSTPVDLRNYVVFPVMQSAISCHMQ